LCAMLKAEFPGMVYSVSCTTRKPRPGEVDGQHYHFVSQDEFDRRLKNGEFLEHALVHGHNYGTLQETVAKALSAGNDVVMAIDVQGAAQIREQVKKRPADDLLRRGFVDVFLQPPSMAVLEERLVKRGQDSPEVIRRRLANAEMEMARRNEYKYRVVNDRLETAYQELSAIVRSEHGNLDG
jgi:guanylate kinase